MTWKVYNAFLPYGSRDGKALGPLPCKRWIPDGKRYKIKHKVTEPECSLDATQYNAAQALKYARWLAARDGVTIPAGLKSKVVWSGVTSATKTRNVHHWNGTRTQAAYLKRVQAVAWGRDHEVYNTRKDGRRGAWLYNEFRAELTIEIPNWDWEPTEPVEQFELEELAA